MTTHSIYERHGSWIVLLGCGLLPFVGLFAKIALERNVNDVKDWLPAHYAETTEYRWFQEHFGDDEFVLISWEGCMLDDPRLNRLAEKLRASGGTGDRAGENLIQRVVTGRSVLEELMAPPANLTREVALNRLRGSLVGPDEHQTCALVWLTPEARRDVHGTLIALRRIVTECGVPPVALRLGGVPVINAAMDAISVQSTLKALIFTCVVSILIAWFSIRDVRLTFLVLVTGLFGAGASLAILPLCGVPMNAVLITMIPMVYTAGTSGAIHLCNYYRESVRHFGTRGAAGRAVGHAWIPLGLAAGTTASGLLSICYNDLVPIQQFGLFSAIGVALSWLLLVFWLPAALAVWPTRNASPAHVETREEDTGEAPLPMVWQRIGDVVIRRSGWMVLGCSILLVACTPGLARLKISIDVLREFPPGAEIIRTYEWLEEKLGLLTSMEVVLRIGDTSELTPWERVSLVDRAQRRLASLDGVGGTMSVANFAPELEGRGPELLRRKVMNVQLAKYRSRLLETGFLAVGEGEELWRISVRVASLRSLDYGEFVSQLRGQVEQELQSERDRGVSAVYTGVAPVIFKARRSLVNGLIWGLGTDLLLITVAIIVMLRNWSSGLLMMLTSIFPTFVVLGAIGWLGLEINVGAVLAPCVALGVTVDDVIHFVIWFRSGVQQGLDRSQAVLLAWHACARPMYQSWALLGLGMATLMVSDFASIYQFGAMMVAMLTAGLVGNLVFLPSLLAGPLGGMISQQSVLPTAAAIHASADNDGSRVERSPS